MKIDKKIYLKLKKLNKNKRNEYLQKLKVDFWYPDNISYPEKTLTQLEMDSFKEEAQSRIPAIASFETLELA